MKARKFRLNEEAIEILVNYARRMDKYMVDSMTIQCEDTWEVEIRINENSPVVKKVFPNGYHPCDEGTT